MERKIGEIFEYNGEWYQCVESDSCGECSLFTTECGSGTKSDLADEVFGECSKARRSDNKFVIFKKLEKVGEPLSCSYYGDNGLIMMQEYKVQDIQFVYTGKVPIYVTDEKHKRVAIAIKQNQEDMEEKKLNLKPFDLKKAREGKPVCTRDGRKARIICFDAKGDKPIIALVEAKGNKDALIEEVERYFINGHSVFEVRETNDDLMMEPEKHEGWVNVYRDFNVVHAKNVFDTREEALKNIGGGENCVATVKIEWEE